jgi:8-oxo-dGTP pyrophosphatase MutT (NUDIX family)
MSELSRREVACAILLDTFGRLLLQQRDNIPGLVFAGMVNLFGGHREGTETYLECVVREIYEEISFFVAPGCFKYLSDYNAVVPEINAIVHGEIFIARDVPAQTLVITEGSLLIINPDELIAVESNLTPVARYAIRAFLKNESGHLFAGVRI